MKNRTAYVTVKFVSELISVTRDAEGGVVEGDPKKVREVTDIWTFARDITAKNPNWKLVATNRQTEHRDRTAWNAAPSPPHCCLLQSLSPSASSCSSGERGGERRAVRPCAG